MITTHVGTPAALGFAYLLALALLGLVHYQRVKAGRAKPLSQSPSPYTNSQRNGVAILTVAIIGLTIGLSVGALRRDASDVAILLLALATSGFVGLYVLLARGTSTSSGTPAPRQERVNSGFSTFFFVGCLFLVVCLLVATVFAAVRGDWPSVATYGVGVVLAAGISYALSILRR